MPYIQKSVRFQLTRYDEMPHNTGELNYIITYIINNYLKGAPESYDEYNSIIGVLECVKQELYRRKIAPYEDRKMEENGDVY